MATTLEAPVHTTVVGVFDDRASARAAIEDLRRAGFTHQRIGFIGPDAQTRKSSSELTVDEDVGIGAALGGAAGGAAGIVVALGMLVPAGPIVAGGAILAYLASVGAGAATGALIGLGIPESDANWYEGQLKAGRILVTVHEADERADDARSILRHNGASVREPSDIGTYGTGLPATPY